MEIFRMGSRQADQGLTPHARRRHHRVMTRLKESRSSDLPGRSDEAASLFDAQSPERMSVAGQHMFEPILAAAAASWTTYDQPRSEVTTLRVGRIRHCGLHRFGRAKHSVAAQYVVAADGIAASSAARWDREHGRSPSTAINVQFDADLDQYLAPPDSDHLIINGELRAHSFADGFTRWRYNFEIPPDQTPTP